MNINWFRPSMILTNWPIDITLLAPYEGQVQMRRDVKCSARCLAALCGCMMPYPTRVMHTQPRSECATCGAAAHLQGSWTEGRVIVLVPLAKLGVLWRLFVLLNVYFFSFCQRSLQEMFMLWLFLSYYIDMMSDPIFLRVKYIGLWWWEVVMLSEKMLHLLSEKDADAESEIFFVWHCFRDLF